MYTPEGFSARDPSLLSVPMRSVKQWQDIGSSFIAHPAPVATNFGRRFDRGLAKQ